MALFQYLAVDETGKKIKGIIEAEHKEEAEHLLHKKNVALTYLELYSKASKTKLTKKEVLSFTEELSKLLQASLPLYDALTALKDKYENHKIYPLILDLSDQIKRGSNFSKALSTYPDNFDFVYCSMIANAEKTGSLIQALEELSKIMQRGQNLKKKVTGALLYPAILSLFCLVVIFSLIFFVIPSLSDLFEGRNLHPLTKIVLAISLFANSYKGFLLSVFLAFISLGFVAIYVKKVKDILFKAVLVLPVISNLMVKVSIIRFSRSFSVLLSTGISYVEALKLAKAVMKHPILEEDVSYAEQKIIEGEKLSSSLKNRGNIPILVIRMLEIAEESGKTSDMLNHIAKIYEDELDKSLTQLTSVLQPLLLLVLGMVVGFIVLSVLIPLTDVSSFTG
jgi:general secretion pathway protein F